MLGSAPQGKPRTLAEVPDRGSGGRAGRGASRLESFPKPSLLTLSQRSPESESVAREV